MCKECQTKPVYVFTNKRQVCRRCFVNYFQKKFLYVNRKFSLLSKGDLVFFKKSNSFRDVVLDYLLNLFSEKVGFVKTDMGKEHNKIADSSSIDLIAYEIIQELMYGNSKKMKDFSPVVKKGKMKLVRPLYLFLDKEILLYGKIKGLGYPASNTPTTHPLNYNNNLVIFINDLEKKHPELKRAIVNSYLKLFL